MMYAAWHKVMEPVHHNNPDCAQGRETLGIYQRAGTGGKPLCQECARLNSLKSEPTSDCCERELDEAGNG